MNDIPDQHLDIPAHAPVMVLPQAVLFPSSHLPLFIFEPRYRAMLAWSLERERMFCIALLREGLNDWHSPADFHHVAGLGLVRACVGREDGTSHLILQGLTRVTFTAFDETQPFVLATLRALPSTEPDPASAPALVVKVRELCAEYRAKGAEVPEALVAQLAAVEDAGVLADIVAHTFVQDAARRQQLLETTNVTERLRMLLGDLREVLGEKDEKD